MKKHYLLLCAWAVSFFSASLLTAQNRGIEKAPDRIQLLKQLYEDELLRALNEDGQRASVYISPQTYFGDGV